MRPYHQRFHSNHRRDHRLAVHAGALVIKTHKRRRLRTKRLWAAGFSAAVALLFLCGSLLFPSTNASSRGASLSWTAFQNISHDVATSLPPKPVQTATTQTPVLQPETPKPKPRPRPVPVASAFSTSLTIKGDDKCQSDTKAALQLIADKAASDYSDVVKYVSIIECVTQGSGMAAYENPPRFLLGDATRQAGTMWLAGSIVHDAHHSKLYHDYQTANNTQLVPGNVWTGRDAEIDCINVQAAALKKMGAEQWMIDSVLNAINTNYWDVPYDQRTW